MNRNKMTELGNGWEEMRRKACQLENEIDLKLVSFSKLGTNYRSARDYGGDSYKSVAHRNLYSDAGSSLNKSTSSSTHMFEVMATEIEQLLASLTQINDSMAEFTEERGLTSHNATLVHMLQRHRDILQDYSHEYQKTKVNILAVKEREELMGAVFRDNSYKSGSSSDMYLKEHDHLLNSDRLVDEQISIAMSTKENLQTQKSSLKSITQKISLVTNRFPVINSLIVRINFRKRRDSIILGIVIAVCVILLLWYTLR